VGRQELGVRSIAVLPFRRLLLVKCGQVWDAKSRAVAVALRTGYWFGSMSSFLRRMILCVNKRRCSARLAYIAGKGFKWPFFYNGTVVRDGLGAILKTLLFFFLVHAILSLKSKRKFVFVPLQSRGGKRCLRS